jgi:diguanylate cyclase
MHYAETAAQSAEILRLILPRIAHHGGHYAPDAYGVWYEHLSGANPPLSAALEAQLCEGTALDQRHIEELYAQYIRSRDVRHTVTLQTNLAELIRTLAEVAAVSGEGTGEYARVLEDCERALGSVNDPQSLQQLIRSLAASTTAARTTTETLRTEVNRSREAMQKLQEQLGTLQGEALTDPLTGLLNRRGFDAAVTRLFGAGSGAHRNAAIVLADIDHFKRVNDTYGHLFGDQVLRACAQVLTQVTKGRDVVARFGGEEFLILLPDTPSQGALALAEQIRAAFGKVRIRRHGQEVNGEQVTISLGVAVPGPAETLEQAIERADQALYQAKSDGRNCVRAAGFASGRALPAATRRTTRA